ncbi:MAG: histidine--tRNA ligase [Ruminococcus sp.]|nr:histidine--tRNA ligase [Ruminococcus sp.]
MALSIKRPLGTEDIVPQNINKWNTVETIVKDTATTFGFKEIRVPTFESTELFERSVGDTTDVVQKEMYSVIAKESKFTLRPEGTSGTIRAMVQNGLLNDALPQKVFYVLSCFRHERPQAGRLREFHQFGVEMAGSQSPYADAEVISLAKSIIDRVGLKNIVLNINSIGCPTCRANYHKALKEFFSTKSECLCDTCKSRLDRNPMRILDCKSPICSDIGKDAPVILDYLCEDCSNHFEKLKSILTNMGIEYSVNPRIVRGLDYYTKTVFEFVTTDIGSQGTICGGGRYDGLIEQLSGKHVPALGFGMGLERLILTMENQDCEFMENPNCELYIAPMGDTAKDKAVELASNLRTEGFLVEYDIMDRGIKAQMKYANKLNAKFVLVIGDNEIQSNSAKLKFMTTGEEFPITLDDSFYEKFSSMYMANMLSDED